MLDPNTILILIGLRGSGKTTLARLLAQRLNRTAIDLDDLTPTYLNEPTAAAALTNHGEPAFRRAELAALQDALKNPGTILALGGGTPTAPGVSEMLEGSRKSGRVIIVYLRAGEETLRARLGGNTGIPPAAAPADAQRPPPESTRPSLTGRGTLEEIGVLLNLRDTLYKTLATHTVEVRSQSPEQIAQDILAQTA